MLSCSLLSVCIKLQLSKIKIVFVIIYYLDPSWFWLNFVIQISSFFIFKFCLKFSSFMSNIVIHIFLYPLLDSVISVHASFFLFLLWYITFLIMMWLLNVGSCHHGKEQSRSSCCSICQKSKRSWRTYRGC